MRLVAWVGLAEMPMAALVWYVRNHDATGAEGGVLWLLAFGAFALAVFVAGAYYERYGWRPLGDASVRVVGTNPAAGRNGSGPPHTDHQEAA